MSDHRIIQGDVLEGLRTIPDGSAHCCATSPPYWGLRNYGVDGQIGLEKTPEEYVKKIVEVFREVKRVLRDDGTLWLNLGDCYANSGGQGDQRIDKTGKSAAVGVQPKPTSRCGLKPKDMIGIPWRVAFALQADGWYLRSDIIWNKPNPMPESVTDRPTKSHEYIFLLTKNARYFYDQDAIREPASEIKMFFRGDEKGRSRYLNQDEHQSNHEKPKKQDLTGNPTYTGFNERWDKKMARNGTNIPGHSGNFKADGTPICDGITRNARTVWTITTQARPEAHFATFPDELPRRCIKAGTSDYGCCPKCGAPYQRIVEATGGMLGKSWHPHENDEVTGQKAPDGGLSKSYRRESKGWQPGCKCDAGEPVPCVVLDPFMGSGTVAVIARELNRSSIGIEINPAYVKIIKKRLQTASQLDSGVVNYQFEKVPV